MQIDRLRIVLKPRTKWEAADLGIKLAVRWYLPLQFAWLVLAAPFFFVAVQLDGFLSKVFLLWWFKPLYERPVLMCLSILIFDGRVTLRGILQGFADWRLWLYLTIFRLSWHRGGNAPIGALEGLDFSTESQRRKWLYEGEERNDFSITSLGLLIELVIVFSIVQLISLLTETDFNAAYVGILKFLTINEIGDSQALILLGIIFVAMGVTAVFYVSVGFATYLNRRTVMEGWDLEIGFKKLISRLGVVALIALLVLPNTAVIASEADESPDRVVAQVLDEPEFNQNETISVPEHMRDVLRWLIDRDYEAEPVKEGAMGQVLATVLKLVLIIALIYVLCLFFYKFYNAYGFGSRREEDESLSLRQTERIKKLPKDVLKTTQNHWEEGRYRDALALLYNAAVAYADGRFTCSIRDSDTEGDCLRKTRNIDRSARNAFVKITRLWRNLAYGGELPSEEKFREAIQGFSDDIAR